MASLDSQLLDFVRLLLGIGFLAIASQRDLRTRTVPNRLWFIMFFAGVIVLDASYLLANAPSVLLLTPIPAMIIFIIIFTEGELAEDALSKAGNAALTAALLLVAIIILVYQGQVLNYSQDWIRSLHVPIMIALAYIFYLVRVLHGGADAKALMALAVLAPAYPSIGPMPLIADIDAIKSVLPFALVVLFDSALAAMLVPLGYAFYNIGQGDVDRKMFFGYRLPLRKVPDRFVWLMERVENGEIITELFPKRRTKKELVRDVDRLRKAGRKVAWVTPKIPFMVPMLFGYLLAFTVGNIILGFVVWIVGL